MARRRLSAIPFEDAMFQKNPFLFSAIVGQEKFKTAYLANIINPRIGGLLVSGPKGTGKSTIVHAAESLLPEYDTVDGCDFNCDPKRADHFCSFCRDRSEISSVRRRMKIVNLPLSCTEDRLIGSVDIEHLLKTGEKKVQAGILGEAHRNILYVDEVNLLPDHLVDDILDAAAMPWNTIEREGVSIMHPAEFILVGTMNPEEGELRPQILDRFPLCVRVESIHDPNKRVEIVKRNLLYENNPAEFTRIFEKDEQALRVVIDKAQDMLPKVTIGESLLYAIAEACAELKVDGQRPDIVIVKTSRTIAALDRRSDVSMRDILLAAELTLSHRTRDGGLLEPSTVEEIHAAFAKTLQKAQPKPDDHGSGKKISGSSTAVDKAVDSFIERGDGAGGDGGGKESDGKKKR